MDGYQLPGCIETDFAFQTWLFLFFPAGRLVRLKSLPTCFISWLGRKILIVLQTWNVLKCHEFMETGLYASWYCWWTKSCTTKDDDYPIIYRVLTIPGGAGFCPSTVWNEVIHTMFVLFGTMKSSTLPASTFHGWTFQGTQFSPRIFSC